VLKVPLDEEPKSLFAHARSPLHKARDRKDASSSVPRGDHNDVFERGKWETIYEFLKPYDSTKGTLSVSFTRCEQLFAGP
jgi:hypothetical protein